MEPVRAVGMVPWKASVLALLVLAMGAAGWAVVSLRVGAVSPAEGTRTNKKQVALTAPYDGVVGGATFFLDGAALPTEVRAATREIVASAANLATGDHRVELRASRALGIGRVDRVSTFTVDTTPPKVALTVPAPHTIVKDHMLKLQGQTEPGTRLLVRVRGDGHAYELPTFVVDADGRFTALVKMADNRNKIRIDAVDAAGNRSVFTREVVCDLTPPAISNRYPLPDAVIKLDPTVTVRAKVAESGAGIKQATLTVDGKAHPIALSDKGGDVRLQLENLPEGKREVVLEVRDRAGWTARQEWSFLVDTVETFGVRPATRGARGKDVATLQRRLIKRGDLAEGHLTSVYDDETENAVQQFQARNGLSVDGLLGLDTIARLSPRIDVELSTFTLTLYDDDKKVKSYRIACGLPEFPTPTGTYHIAYLERNPTWIPPKDSVWAKEAKVTPPGPGNPLGTRWIGLDSKAVGIHGTNAEWTVGSRASHGCLRMRIADVEDLFERVNPGARVNIFEVRPPPRAHKPPAVKRKPLTNLN